VRQQITIPWDADTVTAYFWTYLIAEPSGSTDQAQFVLLDPWNDGVVAVPWRAQTGSQAWQAEARDLTPYRGRTLDVYFNVINDGIGGRMGMYLDDVSVLACRTVSIPPAPAQPTTPPQPTAADMATQAPPAPTPEPEATPTAGEAMGGESPTEEPTEPPTAPAETPEPSPTAEPGDSRSFNTQLIYYGVLAVVLILIAAVVAIRFLNKKP
jgi:hypothetical protein